MGKQLLREAKRQSEARDLVLFGHHRYHSISFLPTDPQTSMAATAAVSPSDYLQPAASTTQASGPWALGVGGCVSLEGLTEADIKPQLELCPGSL